MTALVMLALLGIFLHHILTAEESPATDTANAVESAGTKNSTTEIESKPGNFTVDDVEQNQALDQQKTDSSAQAGNNTDKPGNDPVILNNPTLVQYPRGENLRRRYSRPESHELSENLLRREPAVMSAMPTDGRTNLLEEEIDTYTKTAKRLEFNGDAFDRIVAEQTARLIAPTSGETQLEIHFHTVKTRSAHTHTLQGKIAGEPLSDVQFVYHDGIVHGNVTNPIKGLHYEYRTLGDGKLMVRELDHAAMTARCGNPNACGHDHDGQPCPDAIREELDQSGVDLTIPDPSTSDVAQETTGSVTVDVVVGYDQGARIADGGVSQIEARILDAIDRMNTAFSNSQINGTEMMLLGTIEDPDYVYPGAVNGSMSSDDELGDLSSKTDGILDTVSDYATLLGADFTSFIMKQADGSAGIAYRPGNVSIVARDYITSTRITFAHELGHNLGCDHSWGDSSQAYKSDYGWRLDPDGNSSTTGDRVRTIMAYDWGWTRIPYFANPTIFYGSAPTGAPLRYNATGDVYADQRYVTGGLGYTGSNSGLSGFDGSNPALGALNYETILSGSITDSRYGAEYASNRTTRTDFNVISPSASSEYQPGDTLNIQFTGGDQEYTVSVELYNGDNLDTTIASNLNPATDRSLSWTIPENQTTSTNYFVRVNFSHPSMGSVQADSGQFSILNGTPRVIAQNPSSTPGSSNLNQITFTFSESMAPASFSALNDIISFTGPAGVDLAPQITGSSWANSNTELTVSFNTQSTPGYYRMVIGSQVLDLDGNPMDQDIDGVSGEAWEDSYTATLGISSGSSSSTTIWSDLVGNDNLDAGWTLSGGSWQTGSPNEAPPAGPNSAADGGPILAQNLSGNYNSNESSTAVSPSINCSGFNNVSLSFQGWIAAGKNDTLYIDAWDGSIWHRVFTLTGAANGAGNNSSWTSYSPSLAGYADNNPSFKLRWGLNDTTGAGSGTETGWQIDQIKIIAEAPADPLPAPVVVDHSPSNFVSGSQDSFYIQFSNPMDTGGFGLNDIVTFSGPGGNINASGFSWISDSLLRVNFPAQSAPGTYSLTLAPSIPDIDGYNLDQDGDGTPGESTDDRYTAEFTISGSLLVNIAAASISEGDGANATTATVSRSGTSGSLVVNLSSDDTSEITVPSSVTILDGQTTSPPFSINAVDDSIVDDTRTVTVSASATGLADGSDTIDVTDDDVPTLTLEIDAASISENGGTSLATVTRNTDTSNALTVLLSSNDTSEATVPASVEIPAGSASATFTITAADDALVDGDQVITITASDLGSSGTVASTDFTGRIVNGQTASNINWTTVNVSTPGDLTTDAPDGLFDTSAAANHFAPNRNVDNEGPWSVDVPLVLTTDQISLTDVVLDYQHFDNNGNFQGANRSVNWTLTVTGSSSGQLGSVLVNGASSTSGTETAVFSNPITLTNTETHTLTITAEGLNSGNNTGLAALTINGDSPGQISGNANMTILDDDTAATNDYNTWISSYSVAPQDNFDEDFDKDGLSNGLENYFGTDPSVANQGMNAESVNVGTTTTFTFTHPINSDPASDITATYIWSKDLSTVYLGGQTDPAGTTVTFSQGAVTNGIVTVTATVTGTQPDRLFFDIEVSQTAP